MNYFVLKILTAGGSLFTIIYQTKHAFIIRALFIFYTRNSTPSFHVLLAFLSASFRLSEPPVDRTEKNTLATILRQIHRRQILSRVKMGIHELHHKRNERLYAIAKIQLVEDSFRLQIFSLGAPLGVSANRKQGYPRVLYCPVLMYLITRPYLHAQCALTMNSVGIKLSSLIILIAINIQWLFR